MKWLVALAAACLPLFSSAGNQLYEPLADSVRQRLSRMVSDRAPQALHFRSTHDAQRWIDEMDRRLERRIPDRQSRLELLRAVHYEALRARLDPQLVLGLIEVESGFRKYAVSRAGARGYMQVMPFWVKLIGQPAHNLFHLRTNLAYGCAILRHYLDMEKGDYFRALGRYNGTVGQARLPEPRARGLERALELRRADMIAALLERYPRLAHRLWGFVPPERGTIVLLHRRVYILPARLGALFGATLVILLVGSINYALALGFALTFLLAGLGVAGMVHTARNLSRLGVSTGRVEPVFAGESAQFRLYLENSAGHDRPAVLARHLGSGSQFVIDIPALGAAEVVLSVPAPRRGWVALGRVMLETRFPLGLFRAWSYVEPDARGLVYPQARARAAAARRSRRRRRAACARRPPATTTSPACAPTRSPTRRARWPGRPWPAATTC